jgi:hypothetical protein
MVTLVSLIAPGAFGAMNQNCQAEMSTVTNDASLRRSDRHVEPN